MVRIESGYQGPTVRIDRAAAARCESMHRCRRFGQGHGLQRYIVDSRPYYAEEKQQETKGSPPTQRSDVRTRRRVRRIADYLPRRGSVGNARVASYAEA